jgi:tRNA/rRNA methyltransferase
MTKVKDNKPSIVLVRPQLPENIGMVARAMDNFGLENLILVNPREIWPNDIAIQSSANSKEIISNAKVFKSLNEALSDFHFIVATSNRKRFLNKPHQSNMEKLFAQIPQDKRTAFLFGPENSGLSNEDLILADLIFSINTANSNTSLNLSHAVLLISFNWRNFASLKKNKSKENSVFNNNAEKKDFVNFMSFLKNELNNVGFLYPKNKSKIMFENIQSMFMRSSLNRTEIQTLWGMVKKLRK